MHASSVSSNIRKMKAKIHIKHSNIRNRLCNSEFSEINQYFWQVKGQELDSLALLSGKKRVIVHTVAVEQWLELSSGSWIPSIVYEVVPS